MARVKAQINSAVLAWARNSAGLSPDEAAAKVAGATNAERVLAWERGEDLPTIGQLRKLAEAYRRPLSLFYLAEPPDDFHPMHDFRRLPGEVANVFSPAVRREIRLAHERRSLALELLQDIEIEPRPFELAATMRDAPDTVADSIRDALQVTHEEQTAPRNRGTNSLRYWRHKVEAAGVIVFQAAHIPAAEMLGFSIVAPVLPVVVVNQKTRGARVFTLIHELTHLMLRTSGICDLDEDAMRPPEEQRVEVFCNAVAGAALVPARDILSDPIVGPRGVGRHEWDDDQLDVLATRYGVSHEVILRRLLTLNRTTAEFYRQKRAEFMARYVAMEARLKEQRGDDEIKRNIPQETVTALGAPFVRLVLNNYYQDHITLSDVAGYLGVRVRHVPKIEESVGAGQ